MSDEPETIIVGLNDHRRGPALPAGVVRDGNGWTLGAGYPLPDGWVIAGDLITTRGDVPVRPADTPEPAPWPIPISRHAMLAVWSALGGDQTGFDRMIAEDRRTDADTWTQLLSMVRGDGGLWEDTNPPAGPEFAALLNGSVAPDLPDDVQAVIDAAEQLRTAYEANSAHTGETLNALWMAVAAVVRALRATTDRDDDAPAEPPCRGFCWVGQPFTSCDECGRPAWEHDGMHTPPDNPFDDGPGTIRHWEPGEAEAIRAKWDVRADTPEPVLTHEQFVNPTNPDTTVNEAEAAVPAEPAQWTGQWRPHGERTDTLVLVWSIEEGPLAEIVCAGDVDRMAVAAVLNGSVAPDLPAEVQAGPAQWTVDLARDVKAWWEVSTAVIEPTSRSMREAGNVLASSACRLMDAQRDLLNGSVALDLPDDRETVEEIAQWLHDYRHWPEIEDLSHITDLIAAVNAARALRATTDRGDRG